MVTLTSGVVSVFLGAQAAAGVVGIAVATINASIVAALIAGAFSTLNVVLILYIKKNGDGKKDGNDA